MEEITQINAIIFGNIPSKSNSYKIANIKGKAIMYKSKELKDYEKSFFIQLPPKFRGLKWNEYFKITVDVFYPSNRPDLDNSLKILLDCLQKLTNTIQNDNRCVEIHAKKAVDKKEPRIEFVLLKQ
jgi:Holliday junction resolvase RusA-like endonuclease